ncbi:hypothetical protein Hanom_Chr15g01408671 [Helianthus anomalus]
MTCQVRHLFSKNDLHAELIEKGYDGHLKGVTMYKLNFPPPMKFFFDTLLTYLFAKITAFKEIPLKIQYLGYAILTKSDSNYSQPLFSDLVSNVNNI